MDQLHLERMCTEDHFLSTLAHTLGAKVKQVGEEARARVEPRMQAA
jgi:hypothetical protein